MLTLLSLFCVRQVLARSCKGFSEEGKVEEKRVIRERKERIFSWAGGTVLRELRLGRNFWCSPSQHSISESVSAEACETCPAFPSTEALFFAVPPAGCHPSCKTCTGQGPFSCSSCNASLVLSHTGACAPLCSLGYYRDDRQTCRRECLSPSHLSLPQCIYQRVFACSFAPCSCCLGRKGFKCLKTRCELTEVMSCLRSRACSRVEI